MNGKSWRTYERRALRGGVVLSVLGVAGCGSRRMTDSGSTPSSPSTPASATVSFCAGSETGCAQQSSFPVSSTRDLVTNLHWTDVPAGPHTQKVRYVLPEGAVYQEREASFSLPQGSTSGMDLKDGLPVVGGFISTRQLTGKWHVEVYLDDKLISTTTLEFVP
jgi:hypothetical protein